MFGISSSLDISSRCFAFGFDLSDNSLDHFGFLLRLKLFQDLEHNNDLFEQEHVVTYDFMENLHNNVVL